MGGGSDRGREWEKRGEGVMEAKMQKEAESVEVQEEGVEGRKE